MNKASQIVILCEDRAHEIFARRFLKKGWNVKHRAIRVPPYPSGKGSGKKFVEDSFAREAQGYRTRHASTILLVVQDADEQSVATVKSTLDGKFAPARAATEQIAYIIPKWHIQTWIAYLNGEKVDESDKETYTRKYRAISESKKVHCFVDKLAEDCRVNKDLKSPPDSLVAACKEFDRIRNVL